MKPQIEFKWVYNSQHSINQTITGMIKQLNLKVTPFISQKSLNEKISSKTSEKVTVPISRRKMDVMRVKSF